jgi:hypothetical protein
MSNVENSNAVWWMPVSCLCQWVFESWRGQQRDAVVGFVVGQPGCFVALEDRA